jgi:hypothetical protein
VAANEAEAAEHIGLRGSQEGVIGVDHQAARVGAVRHGLRQPFARTRPDPAEFGSSVL